MSNGQKKITRDMIYNLQYDSNPHTGSNVVDCSSTQWEHPVLMIVFDGGDINNAAHYVARSAQSPFAPNNVVSVYVQESIREAFISKVINQLKPLDPEYAKHPNFLRTKSVLDKLNASTLTAKADVATPEQSPTIVCDFTQNYFGSGPSGVITLHTFRTAKETISLCAKDAVHFESVSIWNENLSCAYELAMNLSYPVYFFNCFNLSLAPIKPHFDRGSTHVTIENNYHYETLHLQSRKRIIVFPIGTIFAN